MALVDTGKLDLVGVLRFELVQPAATRIGTMIATANCVSVGLATPHPHICPD